LARIERWAAQSLGIELASWFGFASQAAARVPLALRPSLEFRTAPAAGKTRFMSATTTKATKLIRWFDEIGLQDVGSVGGKNASLGEMYRELTPRGIRVPYGFAVKTAKAKGVKIGICGQAPSDYPDFCEFLVGEGIDSISLTPDAVLKTTLAVLEFEKQATDAWIE
jgi:hypothetical protein